MKYIKQFGIILFISFIGEILNHLIPFPVPASIYGIIIMLAALKTGIIKVCDVQEVSGFLIELMPVMFIPAAVGLIESWDIIKPVWYMYAIVTVVSTVLVMAIAGLATQAVIRWEAKHRK